MEDYLICSNSANAIKTKMLLTHHASIHLLSDLHEGIEPVKAPFWRHGRRKKGRDNLNNLIKAKAVVSLSAVSI